MWQLASCLLSEMSMLGVERTSISFNAGVSASRSRLDLRRRSLPFSFSSASIKTLESQLHGKRQADRKHLSLEDQGVASV